MERKQEVSKAVIQRLPRYYRNICELKAEGEQRISSKALAERMGLTARRFVRTLTASAALVSRAMAIRWTA